jgi:hypothetical protein
MLMLVLTGTGSLFKYKPYNVAVDKVMLFHTYFAYQITLRNINIAAVINCYPLK